MAAYNCFSCARNKRGLKIPSGWWFPHPYHLPSNNISCRDLFHKNIPFCSTFFFPCHLRALFFQDKRDSRVAAFGTTHASTAITPLPLTVVVLHLVIGARRCLEKECRYHFGRQAANRFTLISFQCPDYCMQISRQRGRFRKSLTCPMWLRLETPLALVLSIQRSPTQRGFQ